MIVKWGAGATVRGDIAERRGAEEVSPIMLQHVRPLEPNCGVLTILGFALWRDLGLFGDGAHVARQQAGHQGLARGDRVDLAVRRVLKERHVAARHAMDEVGERAEGRAARGLEDSAPAARAVEVEANKPAAGAGHVHSLLRQVVQLRRPNSAAAVLLGSAAPGLRPAGAALGAGVGRAAAARRGSGSAELAVLCQVEHHAASGVGARHLSRGEKRGWRREGVAAGEPQCDPIEYIETT